MKISGSDIKPGTVIEHEGSLWLAVKSQAVKPGKGGAYNQVELKNLIDGTKLNTRFRSAETVEAAQLERKDYQFLYATGDTFTFMDQESFEQIELERDFIGDGAAFLQDGMKVMVNSHNGRALSITLPVHVVQTVVECEPTVRGATATAVYKQAVLDNGVRTTVPPFVSVGERIVVATEDGAYVRRAE
ncbi:MAG: elongation factor P [Alphaproteobacteria bacterium]|nr:elongation factor P [Alphaproteobacteria bacterium]